MTASRDELAKRLSDRDWRILESLNEFRFLTTRQLARSYFDTAPDQVVPRRANHALARLKALEVVGNLDRRIGGVRAGSAGHVWTLTDAGSKLLAAHRGASAPTRIRPYEPSATFLEHILAVAEVALVVQERSREQGFAIANLECEPEAWRRYVGQGGAVTQLKPDLALVTRQGDFEDRWFIEVDRDTEPPSRILSKCRGYEQYRATGIEQHDHGVFPAVLWIVPSFRRATQLLEHIGAAQGINADVFGVITLPELEPLLRGGLTSYKNNQGGQLGGHPS